MNKMHSLAKIILSAIGIFFAIRLLSQLPLAIFWFYSKPSWETAGSSLFSVLFVAGAIGLLVYFLIYQHDQLAKKIVGSEQLPEPDSQIQWLPVALRLICIAGGIYFLSIVLWQTTYVVGQFARLKAEESAHTIYTGFAPFSTGNLLPWIITLICGVYLLCGAPHFVRWQVKKILQQCKDRTETM
jgi:NADH:ubiquinone oxidoreductase subunit 5 (subunit L)/multisubunit Na+/H+ antiporter MnhA subunit